MTRSFTDMMNEAIDECAPMKRFKINTNYKHGLTAETKELIIQHELRSLVLNGFGLLHTMLFVLVFSCFSVFMFLCFSVFMFF